MSAWCPGQQGAYSACQAVEVPDPVLCDSSMLSIIAPVRGALWPAVIGTSIAVHSAMLVHSAVHSAIHSVMLVQQQVTVSYPEIL